VIVVDGRYIIIISRKRIMKSNTIPLLRLQVQHGGIDAVGMGVDVMILIFTGKV
jgi:hypothetical protein